MAHTATHSHDHHSILRILATPFIALGRGLVNMSEANLKFRQASFLYSLSDEELAERGLRREDIARHVFKAYLC